MFNMHVYPKVANITRVHVLRLAQLWRAKSEDVWFLTICSSEAFVLRCLASLYIVKKFLLYSNFSNYKCACAYAKIQISVRMPSDVRILYICTEISICITSVWLAIIQLGCRGPRKICPPDN